MESSCTVSKHVTVLDIFTISEIINLNMVRVGVVGAGVIGLSTAINVQMLLPGVDITILADEYGNDTTSSGAGGLFRPNPGQVKGVPLDTLKRWTKESWAHFSKLALSSEASTSGNNVTNGFFLHDKLETLFLDEVVFSYHTLSQNDLRRINSKSRYGYNMTTVVTEPRKYLLWLMRRFKENGGQVIVKTLRSLEELCGQYDVVVNCCGLRADTLVGDKQMMPNRGQLVKVRAPWIRGFYYVEHNGHSTYVIPHSDYVICGGCRQDGVTSTEIDPAMTEDIIQRANEMIPGFEGATVIDQWAGIRPNRTPVRLERETIMFGQKQLKVVHNYGHGGHGISLSWGTAVDAALLVKDIVDNTVPSSRL